MKWKKRFREEFKAFEFQLKDKLAETVGRLIDDEAKARLSRL